MQTYFIRHTQKQDIDDDTRERLWKSRKIAVHFPHEKSGRKNTDTTSLNPEDYKVSDRKAIRALLELAANGGYVCAQYHGHYGEVLVGRIEPRTKVELLRGKWGDLHGLKGRTAILKALPLRNAKVVRTVDYPVMFVGQPRQGTLMRWHVIGAAVQNIIEGRKETFSFASLMPAHQEILCSEFLRLPEAAGWRLPTLAHLILPLGRTMKDIDIFGLATDGKRILAQVTFANREKSIWKLKKLNTYANVDCHLIMFCQTDNQEFIGRVHIVPIEKVFDFFRSFETGRKWRQMVAGSPSEGSISP
ncbi:MAG: hypothetical protein A3J28_09015 [Acidobacteria bacterium RIFCSPLOWO2_12_FULL_60_22]|nr:MAG: hypothetical protein A3J28_09015 [Acidobacteria bacterium RIFCSPLOWO2_12_FULL_60_22]